MVSARIEEWIRSMDLRIMKMIRNMTTPLRLAQVVDEAPNLKIKILGLAEPLVLEHAAGHFIIPNDMPLSLNDHVLVMAHESKRFYYVISKLSLSPAILHSVLDGITEDDHHNRVHTIGTSSDHDPDTLVNISGRITDGTIELATQVEAETGIDNTKRMTPLRTKEAIDAFPTSLDIAVQRYFDNQNNIGFFFLGSPVGDDYVDDVLVGLGFVTVLIVTAGTPILSGNETNQEGKWSLQAAPIGAATGTVGLNGPVQLASFDWTLEFRGNLSGAGDGFEFVGFKPTPRNFGDESNLIGFRKNGTGNIVGVCDSGGAETVRDSGVVSGEHVWRIEVREGGTIVRFYMDDVQIGGDVITNIPTGLLVLAAGGTSSATGSSDLSGVFIADLFGWREA